MRFIARRSAVLNVAQLILGFLLTTDLSAQVWQDSDNPHGLEFGRDETISGNPLGDGDDVYSLRGTHRFLRGDLGIEIGLSHAEPTSDFVRALGPDAELFVVDFSVVWYANYRSYYRKAAVKEPWHDYKSLKPELIVFGGPGWGGLRINDAFPNFPISDASKDYFVLHAGVGAKIHWYQTNPLLGWDHKTSRWYVRPEVRGRWFAGEHGTVDWTVGLSLGVTFGKRPSRLACELSVREANRAAEYLLSKELSPAINKQTTGQEVGELSKKAAVLLAQLGELRASHLSCYDELKQLDDVIRRLQVAHTNLGGES